MLKRLCLIYNKSFHSNTSSMARKKARYLKTSSDPTIERNEFGRKDILQTYYDQSTQSKSDAEESFENKDWYLNEAININLPQQQESKEFIPLWMKNQQQQSSTIDQQVNEDFTLQNIVNILKREHGKNMTVINMREKCDYTDVMIIVEGKTKRQIYGMLESVRLFSKGKLSSDPLMHIHPTIEGSESDDWMVLDLKNIIIHAFTPEKREHYNLEGLWTLIKDPLRGLSREKTVETFLKNWESRQINKEHIKDTEDLDIPVREDYTLK